MDTSFVRNSVLHNDKIKIYEIRTTHRKKYYYNGKIGLKLRVQMEPLVCNQKIQCHRIKNASSKMEKLPISYFVSCDFQTFFSDL